MSQEPSEETKAVVDTVLGACNSKNSKLFNDSFGEVAIIDGFADLLDSLPLARDKLLSHESAMQVCSVPA